MKNKQLQIVSFEQAERLKKAGFDWVVTEWYNDLNKDLENITSYFPIDFNKEKMRSISGNEINCISAPSVALALKWFRDEKGCTIGIGDTHSIFNGKEEVYRACFNRKGMNERSFVKESEGDIGFKTYELAESALLDELLTLIEK